MRQPGCPLVPDSIGAVIWNGLDVCPLFQKYDDSCYPELIQRSAPSNLEARGLWELSRPGETTSVFETTTQWLPDSAPGSQQW